MAHPSSFPDFLPEVNEDVVAQEKKKTVVSATNTEVRRSFMSLEHLENWTEIVKHVAIESVADGESSQPSQEELQAAECELIKEIQKFALPPDHGFCTEIQ